MLTIKNLKAAVEEKTILKGVNLQVNPGEVHAIMGPNGSGKSSLAHILSGREGLEATEGSVDFDGENLLELRINEGGFMGWHTFGGTYWAENSLHGAKSLALSGRVADGTLLGWLSSPDYVRWAIEQIAVPGHVVATLAVTSIDSDADAARDRIRPFATDMIGAMAGSPQIQETGATGVADPLDVHAVAGDPDRCVASVQALFDAGSQQVVFVTSPGGLVDGARMRSQVDLLAETVLPEYR